MSFGYSGGDIVLLTQLAWNVVQGARKACGEHDELARELSGLHTVLQRLRIELTDVKSPLRRCDAERREELEVQIGGCERLLKVVDTVLTKYNALEDCERSGKKLWQKIRFGNGETKDLADIRLKICTHTQAITMALNLISLGSQGRIETQLSHQGRDVSGIRESVNWIVAKMAAVPEASVMTNYTNDSKAFWREMRRELVSEGYPSFVIQRHKSLIKAYVKELGDRGVLDEHSGVYSEPLTHFQPEGESLSSNLAAPHMQNQVMIESEDLYSAPNQSHSDMRPNQEIGNRNGPAVGTEELLEVETIPTLDGKTKMDSEGRDQTGRSNRRRVCGTDKHQGLIQSRNNSLPSGGHPNGDVNSQTPFTISESGIKHLSGQCVKDQQFLKELENSRNMVERLNTPPSKLELTGPKDDQTVGYIQLSEMRHETVDQIVNVIPTSASSESSISANAWHERVSKTDNKSVQIAQPYHPNLSKQEEEKIEEGKPQADASSEASAKVTNLALPGPGNISVQFVEHFDSLLVPNKSMKSSTNNSTSNWELLDEYIAHGLLEEFTFFWDGRRGRYSALFKKLESPQDITDFIEQKSATDDILGPWVQSGSYKVIDTQDGSPMASIEWRSMLRLGLWMGMTVGERHRHLMFFLPPVPTKNSSLEAVSTQGNPAPHSYKSKCIFVKHWATSFWDIFQYDSRYTSWEVMTEILKFVYFNFKNYRALFDGGHFDLLDPNGKIIRPELWSSLVQPEWIITLVMRQPPTSGELLGLTPRSPVNMPKEPYSDSSEDEYDTRKLQATHAGGVKSRSGRRRRKPPTTLGSFWGAVRAGFRSLE